MITIHGTEFDSCEICDKLLTPDDPGYKWTYTWNGHKYAVHVCKDCFNNPDYKELVKSHGNVEKSIYPKF